MTEAIHHIERPPSETEDDHWVMTDGQRIQSNIEFRGYDYFCAYIYLCEDRARIEAMRARRYGKRATVKRNGDWWVLYLR